MEAYAIRYEPAAQVDGLDAFKEEAFPERIRKEGPLHPEQDVRPVESIPRLAEYLGICCEHQMK